MTGNKTMDDQARALIVQKHQLDGAQTQLGQLGSALDAMLASQTDNQQILDLLLSQVQSCVAETQITFEVEGDDVFLTDARLHVQAEEITATFAEIAPLDHVEMDAGLDWQTYLARVESYATRQNVAFGADPFQGLMSVSQKIALEKRIKEEFSLRGANCDKYDYMIAGTCGLIGGLIDVLFVGVPGNSALGNVTRDYADKATEKFAVYLGFDKVEVEKKYSKYVSQKLAKGKQPLDLERYFAQQRITFLEGRFKVNYDHTSTNGKNGTNGKVKNLSAKNHHIKSLGHSPDIVGLFFSILNQFTNTASFVSDGRLVTIDTKNFELQGGNFAAKVFCGFVNWFGHIMSDLAGSNSSIAKGKPGMGVPIPFFSLLQFLDFGEFGQHRQSFAKIAVQVFEQGYDFRHGMAMAVPVLVAELLTRITWVVKQRFYHKSPWSECIPSASNPELRRMLLVAHGSLCLVDAVDAGLRSGGNMIQFMLRSNLIAWARFGTLALKELAVWYREGDLDVEAVDRYLDAEYQRLLSSLGAPVVSRP